VTPARVVIDDLDRQLVDRLRVDGRETNRSLATALGVTEATVASRLRRLEAADVMRVVAVADMASFGLTCLAFLFIRTRGRAPREVAADLAEHSEVIASLVSTGRHDVVVSALARDTQEMAAYLADRVSVVAGVGEVHCNIAAHVGRFDSHWAGLQFGEQRLPRLTANGHSAMDIALIEVLQEDARASNRSVAARLGVSEATVRSRVRRLESAGHIRIQAVSDVESFGISAYGMVGVIASPGRGDDVIDVLAARPEFGMVARTIGTYDAAAVVAAPTRDALIDVTLSDVAGHPAVARVEVHESCWTLKHVYTWSKISA